MDGAQYPALVGQQRLEQRRRPPGVTLGASFLMSLIAALASWLRGAKYVHDDTGDGGGSPADNGEESPPAGPFGAPTDPHAPADQAPEPEKWVPA